MNSLVFYNVLILFIVRSIGLGIAIDFYYKTKEYKFKLSILGWICGIIAASMAIYSGFITDNNTIELILFLNALFALLGAYFYVWAFHTYFVTVSYRPLTFLLIFLITLPTFLFIMVNFRIAIILSSSSISIIFFSVYILPLIKRKRFKEQMGFALKWFYVLLFTFALYFPIAIFITLQGLGYGLYNTNNIFLITLNYLPIIISTILLIILLIHVEYNYSYHQRFELKDKYSHNLGNTLQFITGYIDAIAQPDKIKEKELLELQNLFKIKRQEASDLLREIREL